MILVFMMEKTSNVIVETLSVLMKKSGSISNNILLIFLAQKHKNLFLHQFSKKVKK
jgi:hypothetical protein